ncbi:hypothetical protein [Lentibacillus cibarius]|uniref:Uncharacterized protein n=1 Tax=Lentibacillus cibarius TaxID=2583219 RepID=A0A5S3QIB8_9BACI|nr:hypothetical protein [Lentibacillus cibarius]TMN21652.1 hypothetical protein FFL34_05650 [Lentibacillus cibarius]
MSGKSLNVETIFPQIGNKKDEALQASLGTIVNISYIYPYLDFTGNTRHGVWFSVHCTHRSHEIRIFLPIYF